MASTHSSDFLMGLPASHQRRASVFGDFNATGKNMKTDGGLKLLKGTQKTEAIQLFDDLQRHGVFVVRRGEVENWLPALRAPGKKTDWAVAMLEKLGSDPIAHFIHKTR